MNVLKEFPGVCDQTFCRRVAATFWLCSFPVMKVIVALKEAKRDELEGIGNIFN